jgi:hypothetical protein
MFGGTTATADLEGELADARFLLGIAKLMVDPEAVSARLLKLYEETKKNEAVKAELAQRENVLQDREQRVTAREAAVVEAERRAEEREHALQDLAARAKEQREALEHLKVELKQKMAA